PLLPPFPYTTLFRSLFFNEERRLLSPGDRETLARCAGRVLLVDGDRHLPWDERRRLHRAAATADRTLFARHRRGFLPELIRLERDRKSTRLDCSHVK